MAPSLRTLSTALASGSGIMTMPGPPPKGRSSTLRCLSSEKSRGFTQLQDRSPFSRARSIMLASMTGANISGKSVTKSILIF
ncbi:MAG: hypothetical protein A2506_08330 [Elusimicrobia bacterium RIFOXYD12_FULL_66_9]|nr:MAG: hypothetical protein A2506_08330 [Elusimicrobia bacterium RIFOXYD12_FULL_66_9]